MAAKGVQQLLGPGATGAGFPEMGRSPGHL